MMHMTDSFRFRCRLLSVEAEVDTRRRPALDLEAVRVSFLPIYLLHTILSDTLPFLELPYPPDYTARSTTYTASLDSPPNLLPGSPLLKLRLISSNQLSIWSTSTSLTIVKTNGGD